MPLKDAYSMANNVDPNQTVSNWSKLHRLVSMMKLVSLTSSEKERRRGKKKGRGRKGMFIDCANV